MPLTVTALVTGGVTVAGFVPQCSAIPFSITRISPSETTNPLIGAFERETKQSLLEHHAERAKGGAGCSERDDEAEPTTDLGHDGQRDVASECHH